MNNIILIGMPGAGKSTIGVVLAKKLGFDFIDSDLVIQNQYKKVLQELINEYGTDGFEKIENDVNKGIKTTNSVQVAVLSMAKKLWNILTTLAQ